jgi:hypothetical protein
VCYGTTFVFRSCDFPEGFLAPRLGAAAFAVFGVIRFDVWCAINDLLDSGRPNSLKTSQDLSRGPREESRSVSGTGRDMTRR